ncbi:hypothetical protein [Saccharopolyspora mangrovi]|uniref:Uncharacterized protein n=1 Tax=Saccharopolyspora mangrovi TaxID=3082379 RepID=A0ABU6A7C5_9PSEU|nr:hypothetical protein [Saccharopolyspora sp. S2-29]MEB3367381.1 hypothetical protein [Saccharopolyspora sp. S2-29]
MVFIFWAWFVIAVLAALAFAFGPVIYELAEKAFAHLYDDDED